LSHAQCSAVAVKGVWVLLSSSSLCVECDQIRKTKESSLPSLTPSGASGSWRAWHAFFRCARTCFVRASLFDSREPMADSDNYILEEDN
jgi:hypothetical protein